VRRRRRISAPSLLVGALLLVAGGAAGRPPEAGGAPGPGRTTAPGAACFPATPPTGPEAGPGALDPFRPARPDAAALNREGKSLYQKGQFAEARARYRAALAADPDFLAPALNVACSFVRQERFAEATAEVEALLARSYMPWSAEILAAADLGALKVRPEWASIARAFEGARRIWAQGLPDDVLFVGRTHAPLGYGGSPSGVFVLGPRQEVFAWSPRTLRTRQLTAEEGRVLALLPAPAHGAHAQAAYVVAEKVLRAGGVATALRGVTLVVVDLGDGDRPGGLTSLGRLRVEGDVQRLELASTPAGFAFAILRAPPALPSPQSSSSGPALAIVAPGGAASVRFERGTWQARTHGAAIKPEVTLEPTGVVPSTRWRTEGGACPMRVRDAVGPAGDRAVEIRSGGPDRARVQACQPGQSCVRVGGPEGAASFGLPL
jgi:hypothetical protein